MHLARLGPNKCTASCLVMAIRFGGKKLRSAILRRGCPLCICSSGSIESCCNSQQTCWRRRHRCQCTQPDSHRTTAPIPRGCELDTDAKKLTACFTQAATGHASSFRPDWSAQVITLVVRCCLVSSKERLLLALEDEFNAAEIERFWTSLHVVVEKRSKPRGNRRGSA